MSDRIDDLTTLTRALVKQSDLDEQKILQEQAEEDYREMPTGGLPLKTVEELDQVRYAFTMLSEHNKSVNFWPCCSLRKAQKPSAMRVLSYYTK